MKKSAQQLNTTLNSRVNQTTTKLKIQDFIESHMCVYSVPSALFAVLIKVQVAIGQFIILVFGFILLLQLIKHFTQSNLKNKIAQNWCCCLLAKTDWNCRHKSKKAGTIHLSMRREHVLWFWHTFLAEILCSEIVRLILYIFMILITYVEQF